MEPTISFFSSFQPSDFLYLAEAAWRTVLISVLSISIGTFLGAIFGYGVEVFVSSACPTASSNRVAVMLHKDALVLAEQQSVRSQTQYQQQYLGDLFTADTIYGVKELRDNAGVSILVPST